MELASETAWSRARRRAFAFCSPIVFIAHSVCVWGLYALTLMTLLNLSDDHATDVINRAAFWLVEILCLPISAFVEVGEVHIFVLPFAVFLPSSLIWAAVAAFAGRRMHRVRSRSTAA